VKHLMPKPGAGRDGALRRHRAVQARNRPLTHTVRSTCWTRVGTSQRDVPTGETRRLTSLLGSFFYVLIAAILAAGCNASPTNPIATQPQTNNPTTNTTMKFPVAKTDAEWRQALTPEQYQVLRRAGTEMPFTGKYWNTKEPGVYRCAACGAVLFRSADKFDSGCGWPSFSELADRGTVVEREDSSHGMHRIEVLCAGCGGHLGHVFDDGPAPTGLRYCINSMSLNFEGTNSPDAKK
jgi:methionine-R-sulfoxide reductase